MDPLAARLKEIADQSPAAAQRVCARAAALLDTAAERGRPFGEVAEALLAPAPVPVLSVVLPMYNEQENVAAVYKRLSAVLPGVAPEYEIIFVDDGSSDRSVAAAAELAQQDPHVLVIELARNFGQQAAYSAGLRYARGQAVVTMDCDLQDPPEAIPELVSRWREGFDVVYAVRTGRKEAGVLRAAYWLFYRLYSRLAEIDVPLDSGDFALMDRRIVELLTAMPERNRFLRGIRSWVGLRQLGLPIERGARYAGRPKYSLRSLMRLALDGLISFSFVPLRLISMVGVAVSLLSIALAIFYGVKKLLVGLNPPGFATIVVMISFFSGVQLITLGVLGEYVGRIFEEVKQRPLFVVRAVHGKRAE